ncbi:unnamed protein product (mitochondrion) [Plasmodiophora brassicae]|uniref:Origin recognition complex subunit 4 C-terminal domain-containing protein n=1 Tax=Plasmodiophora brassicae TaxID=37360 RepID=A0A0G4IKH0_PLABS|nr:hypothetical protein PBRA_004385 [Plasmodiophora brassicae]SPR00529.1 unnamed protein product [Plasmodiophora brassicae]
MDGELDVAKACCRRVLRPLLHATWDRRSLPLVDSAFACAAFGVVDAADALRVLLGRTVVQGLSRSAIVVGPAHQARIAMIHALNLVDQGLGGSPSSYAVVHLSGLLHTSDGIALKTLSRQLHIEFEGGEFDVGMSSFRENMAYVLKVLRETSRINQPLIVVIDAFERFAQRPRQSLLYHLFDLAHHAAHQIAIIGITTHADVVSLLEHRVRSRFSNHRVVLRHQVPFDHLVHVLRRTLSLPGALPGCSRGFVDEFNAATETVFADGAVQGFLRAALERKWDMRRFFDAVAIAINRMPPTLLSTTHVMRCLRSLDVDPIDEIVFRLSPYQIALLVAMMHLEKRSICPYTFEMVYEEWRKFQNRDESRRTWRRQLFSKAFEQLIEANVVRVDSSGAGEGCMLANALKRFQQVMVVHEINDLRQRIVTHGERGKEYPTWLSEWIKADYAH